TVFELVHGLHQTDVAFLDEIEKLKTAVGVFLRDGDNQAKVRFDHLLLRLSALPLALLYGVHDAAEIADRLTHFLCERLDIVAVLTNSLPLFVHEVVPALAAQPADAARPVGIELVSEMLLQEFAAV